MKEPDKCLDPHLWHACAGGMVQMASVYSKVYYFPQGHAEHAVGPVGFGASLHIPALILCRVIAVKFMANPESDEVFAKIQLVPVQSNEPGYDEDGGAGAQEKPASFAKTLTQSDANNGGGFSIPRYCAETIFPRLDYSAHPPVQTVLAKDVHGEVWKFRHIYRGTPRRHLLTTGWSTFVNRKKLVAGDSVVFLRTEAGELCVGIRRAKRGLGGGPDTNYARGMNMRGRGGVIPETVVEATRLATNGQPFEVLYYPRASTPEFVVKAAAVRAAMKIQWRQGIRFKMAFETEDSSRISWFMGTVSSVQAADPVSWPNSLWRILQVTWDEPDLLQDVKSVSPWLVELILAIPPIHLAPFSPPRKKLRIPLHPDFCLEGHLPIPILPDSALGPGNGLLCCFPDSTAPASIQGARHALLVRPPSKFSTGIVNGSPPNHDAISCLLTLGAPQSAKKPENRKAPHFVLFGKPIFTEQQISPSNSQTANADGLGSGIDHTGILENSGEAFPMQDFQQSSERWRELTKMARRLTILTDADGDCIGP